jgi:hypothetical protein
MATSVDLNKPVEELLDEIANAVSRSAGLAHAPDLALPPFAVLLVRLSREAAATADINLRIQNRLIALTWTILGVSIAMTLIGVLQYVHTLRSC